MRDPNGNTTEVSQDHQGTSGTGTVVTSYAYDVLDRMTSMTTQPAAGTELTTFYTLDGDGNVTARTTADGVTTNYAYDALSRLTSISATGLSTITYGYDEMSHRTAMSDGTGTSSYAYDGLGRLTQAAQPSGTTNYSYDLDSNRTSLTYPGSLTVAYTFSNAGRLSSLTDWGSRNSSYTYRPTGLPASVTLPNGMVTSYTYDRAQRLTDLTNVLSGTTITSHSYTLDNDGNPTALDEYVVGITAGSSDNFGFGYDGLERLTAVTTTNPEGFMLDGASNITARTGPSATYTIDSSNRPTSDGTNTLTWSNADRLTGRGADTFGYDPLDRLSSSTISGTLRDYAYNGDGLVQSRTTNGTTVSFLWDPATSSSRLLVSGSEFIVYGLGPLYSINGSAVTTYARDGQKSVRAELNGSSITGSWRYRAYGDIAQINGSSTPILGYAGQLLDTSGLYYMRTRWYDPTIGRFLSRDPVHGDPLTPFALNGFDYAAGNPIRFSDPSGAFCIPCLYLAVVAVTYIATQVTLTAIDAYATYQTFADPSTGPLERGAMVGLTLAGLADPVGGGYAAYRRSTRTATRSDADFAVTPKGVAVPIPKGADVGPTTNGKGLLIANPSTGANVRIMDPDADVRYPGGYLRMQNEHGNYLDAFGTPNADPSLTHIPLFDSQGNLTIIPGFATLLQ